MPDTWSFDEASSTPDTFLFPTTNTSLENPVNTVQPYEIVLDGINVIQDAFDALRSRDSNDVAELSSSVHDLANSLSEWFNLPSEVQLGLWNDFSLIGLAPGSVYVTYYEDGFAEFSRELNENFGPVSYQISWHTATDSTDWSGPVIDFF